MEFFFVAVMGGVQQPGDGARVGGWGGWYYKCVLQLLANKDSWVDIHMFWCAKVCLQHQNIDRFFAGWSNSLFMY